MSLWWIGVKPNGKMRAFEATRAEAFSPEFEQRFGLAFGSFRSKVQAESDIKRHHKHLLEQADIVRSKQDIPVQNGDIPLNTVEKANKHAEKASEAAQKPMKTSKPAELSDIPQRLQTISLVFEELDGLKLAIIRAIEAVKLLKVSLEELEDDKSNG